MPSHVQRAHGYSGRDVIGLITIGVENFGLPSIIWHLALVPKICY